MSTTPLLARFGADPTDTPPGQRVRVDLRSGRRALAMGHARLLLVGLALAVAFLAISVRLVALAAPESRDSVGATKWAAVDPGRAQIVDRNDVVLAANLAVPSLYANPRKVLSPVQAAASLATALPELDLSEALARLRSGRGFVWLARHLTPRQQMEVLRLGLPGIGFRSEQRRVYPHASLTAHAVGYADLDANGLGGVEQGLDAELRAFDEVVRLSLDVRVQHVLRRELALAMTEFSAVGAAGVVMDVATGEVVALTSLPDFDPNRMARSSSQARFNRATLGIYEPGSTLKILTAAMALEYGAATFDTTFDATLPLRIDRHFIRDLHPENRWLTLPEIFVYSSNIGAARMAMQVGAERQRAFLARLGMLDRPNIEIGEAGAPLYPAQWGEISTMTVAYGHGIAVSQLQIAAAFASVINGGTLVKPTFLAQEFVAPGERVVSEKTSRSLRALLRLNVIRGTGKLAAAPGFLVGGKTGTAEKAVSGGYDRETLVSSFVAAFPMNAPRYAVLVMLDEPKGTDETHGFATAGWTAAPTVSRVIAGIAPLVGVLPQIGVEPEGVAALQVLLRGRTERAAF